MPSVTATLTEQFSDFRSNEIAYRLSVENKGQVPISIIDIAPRLPDGVKLIEARNPSLASASARQEALCKELTALLNAVLAKRRKDAQEVADSSRRSGTPFAQILSRISVRLASSIFPFSLSVSTGESDTDDLPE